MTAQALFALSAKKLNQMAFENDDLNVLAYANGFTLWGYVSNDDMADIFSKDYFSAVKQELRCGDIIIVSSKRGLDSQGAFLVVCEQDSEIITKKLFASV